MPPVPGGGDVVRRASADDERNQDHFSAWARTFSPTAAAEPELGLPVELLDLEVLLDAPRLLQSGGADCDLNRWWAP